MAEFQLYCFAQSGNAYRAALMLNLIGADWEPVWIDFFAGGATRKPEYRETINEMGEVPVLVHGPKKLTQSGVILTYLADLTGKFKPEGEDEKLESLRWIIFDNQKVNGFLGPYRFLKNFAPKPPDPAVMDFMKGRIDGGTGRGRKAAHGAQVPGGGAADHRRHFDDGLSLLSGGRIRLRHRRHASGHRRLARPHQGPARLGPSLRPDARLSVRDALRHNSPARPRESGDGNERRLPDSLVTTVTAHAHPFGCV